MADDHTPQLPKQHPTQLTLQLIPQLTPLLPQQHPIQLTIQLPHEENPHSNTISINPADIEKYKIIENDLLKYKCIRCSTVFNQKRYLMNHIKNTKTCTSRVKFQQLITNRTNLVNSEREAERLKIASEKAKIQEQLVGFFDHLGQSVLATRRLQHKLLSNCKPL